MRETLYHGAQFRTSRQPRRVCGQNAATMAMNTALAAATIAIIRSRRHGASGALYSDSSVRADVRHPDATKQLDVGAT